MGGALIAFATEQGLTREIAEALAEALREEGLQADVAAAHAACDLAPYDVVILGAPLYRGRWHRDALDFLKCHCESLANRDVAIFALNAPTFACEGGWLDCREQLAGALSQSPWLDPISVALFDGVDRRMHNGDQRDWDEARSWAVNIARRCRSAARPVAAPARY